MSVRVGTDRYRSNHIKKQVNLFLVTIMSSSSSDDEFFLLEIKYYKQKLMPIISLSFDVGGYGKKVMEAPLEVQTCIGF